MKKSEVKDTQTYKGHRIFEMLKYYADFYNSLSFSIMSWHSFGTKAILNLDSCEFSSISNTLHSISEILLKGRINDGYALLRKYYDSTIINIYTSLYLMNQNNGDTDIVDKIENWRKGTETIPEFRIISKYIKDSEMLSPINQLLSKDKRYKEIRDKCNDNTHYNFIAIFS